MSNILKRLLNIAVTQAYKSDMYHQHGAVLFNGHRVLGVGYNRIDRSKIQIREMMFSTHAERDCMQRILCAPRSCRKKHKHTNYSILVVRLNRTGKLVNSRPCDDCVKKLRALGVGRIYYSDDNGELIGEKLSEMKLCHVSAGKKYMMRCGHVNN